jgi:hypothetical protein
MPKFVERKPTAGKDKRDRWNVLASALASEHETIFTSTPKGVAQRLMERKISATDAVSAFFGWNERERLEFARVISRCNDDLFKHNVAQELKAQNGCRPINPEVVSLLDFRVRAETIALEHIGNLGGKTPNSIAGPLIARFEDRELIGLLANAFEAAATLCDDSQKNDRRLLSGVAKRLNAPWMMRIGEE